MIGFLFLLGVHSSSLYFWIILNSSENNVFSILQVLPKDQAPLMKDARTIILDVKCTDAIRKQYILEMQNRKEPFFIKRAQLYVTQNNLLDNLILTPADTVK